MTASVLVKGTLLHAPESRTLKNGGLCVKATLKAKDGDYTRFWHILAFDEAVQAALLRLSDGDAVAVQGSLKAELHDRNGETALSFGVIAERAQSLHQPGKKRSKEERGFHATAGRELPPLFVQ
jgi:single-stranded DNA-binding protein